MIGSAENKVAAFEAISADAGMPAPFAAIEAASPMLNPLLLSGFSNYRYQQTLIKGGFKDSKFMSSIRPGSRRAGLRSFAAGSLTPTDLNSSSFFGGRNIFGQTTRRGQKFLNRAAGSSGRIVGTGGQRRFVADSQRATYGMGRGFRTNYNPFNMLRGRYSNLSVFGAGPKANFYAPNQGGFFASIGNIGSADNPRFSGGVVGRLGALSKMERVANKGGIRANKRLAKFDLNLARVANMNNPASINYMGGQFGRVLPRSAGAGIVLPAGQTMLNPLGMSLTGAAGAASVTTGMRRYAAYEGVKGRYSKSFMRGILTSGGGAEMRTLGGTVTRQAGFGVANIKMSQTAENIIRPLAAALEGNDKLLNRAVSRGVGSGSYAFAPSMADDIVKARMGTMATEIVDKGIIKSLGTRGAIQAAKTGGARVGLAVAGEAAFAAIPGLNLIFAADMAYQLAKLAGKGVQAGINFAKDGMKSMQGTMNNGVFGAGYQDNEVAATSRARGVMAIQNSRLNARSLLGSEASMMHAHFG